MATIADALCVSLNLDGAGFLKSLAQVEARAASGVRAVAENLNAPAQMSSGGLAEMLQEAVRAVGELTAALRTAAQALRDMAGSLGGVKELAESVAAIRKELADLRGELTGTGAILETLSLNVGSGIILAGLDKLIKKAGGFGKLLKFIGKGVIFFVSLVLGGFMEILPSLATFAGALGNVAGVIAARVIPAVMSFGAALLANPLTWIALIVAALGYALYDLWNYISTGESTLSGLWSLFGTGEEVGRALGDIWNNLIPIAGQLLNALIEYGPALASVAGALSLFSMGMRLLGIAAASNPVLALVLALALAATWLIANWDKVYNFFAGLLDDIGRLFSDFGDWLRESMPDWMKDLFGIDDAELEANINKTKGTFKAAERLNEVGQLTAAGAATVAATYGISPEGLTPALAGAAAVAVPSYGGASSALSPALMAAGASGPAGAPMDRSVNNTFGDIQIYTQATDGQGIMDAFSDSLSRRLVSIKNYSGGY